MAFAFAWLSVCVDKLLVCVVCVFVVVVVSGFTFTCRNTHCTHCVRLHFHFSPFPLFLYYLNALVTLCNDDERESERVSGTRVSIAPEIHSLQQLVIGRSVVCLPVLI